MPSSPTSPRSPPTPSRPTRTRSPAPGGPSPAGWPPCPRTWTAVVVTSGDVPLLDTATLKELLAQHTQRGDAVTLLTTELDDPTGYGRVVREADGTVSAVVEQRDASEAQRAIREINAGVYVFDAAHLRTAPGDPGHGQ